MKGNQVMTGKCKTKSGMCKTSWLEWAHFREMRKMMRLTVFFAGATIARAPSSG